MTRRFVWPLLHFGLAIILLLATAPHSSAAEEGPGNQLRSASLNASIKTLPTRKPAPVFSFAPAADPAASEQQTPGTTRELLPDLGQIGAQVSLLLGRSTNPFKADDGFLAGTYIELPLFKVGGGKVSYEIAITHQTASTDVRITSPLSAIGDLLAVDGLGGTLTSRVLSSLKDLPAEEDFDLLTVLPFGLKYTITSLDRSRFRPYVLGSFGVYATITDQDPKLTVDPRLGGAIIGGIVPQAVELTARGVPEGQGDLRFGGNIGGGVEFRVGGRGSLGFEYRFHRVEGTNGDFSTFAGKIGFHF